MWWEVVRDLLTYGRTSIEAVIPILWHHLNNFLLSSTRYDYPGQFQHCVVSIKLSLGRTVPRRGAGHRRDHGGNQRALVAAIPLSVPWPVGTTRRSSSHMRRSDWQFPLRMIIRSCNSIWSPHHHWWWSRCPRPDTECPHVLDGRLRLIASEGLSRASTDELGRRHSWYVWMSRNRLVVRSTVPSSENAIDDIQHISPSIACIDGPITISQIYLNHLVLRYRRDAGALRKEYDIHKEVYSV